MELSQTVAKKIKTSSCYKPFCFHPEEEVGLVAHCVLPLLSHKRDIEKFKSNCKRHTKHNLWGFQNPLNGQLPCAPPTTLWSIQRSKSSNHHLLAGEWRWQWHFRCAWCIHFFHLLSFHGLVAQLFVVAFNNLAPTELRTGERYLQSKQQLRQ